MEIKLIEIRDRGTFIPAMAVKLNPTNEKERYLLARAGYRDFSHEPFILLAGLNTPDKTSSDPYDWDNRSRQVGHDWLIKNWGYIESGAVVDVEFILGETKAPKQSEALDDGILNAYRMVDAVAQKDVK